MSKTKFSGLCVFVCVSIINCLKSKYYCLKYAMPNPLNYLSDHLRPLAKNKNKVRK